jgi:hypothetical protein
MKSMRQYSRCTESCACTRTFRGWLEQSACRNYRSDRMGSSLAARRAGT